MACIYGWAPEKSEPPLQPQQDREPRVGQAFQPDFPKSQAGKPGLQKCEFRPGAAGVFTTSPVVDFKNLADLSGLATI